jgi:hypothetical protein
MQLVVIVQQTAKYPVEIQFTEIFSLVLDMPAFGH